MRSTVAVVPQVGKRRRDAEHGRERVLLLGDPRDRLGADRMRREERRAKEGAGHGEAAKEEEEQEGRDPACGETTFAAWYQAGASPCRGGAPARRRCRAQGSTAAVAPGLRTRSRQEEP